MTMRYAHLAPAALTAAMNALEGLRSWQHLQIFGQPAVNNDTFSPPQARPAPVPALSNLSSA